MNASTESGHGSTDILGLRSVLVGSLPAALMTTGAPDRYTVEAVFTRRPEEDELRDAVKDRAVASREEDRAASAARLAESVSFTRSRGHDARLDDQTRAHAYESQVVGWATEGGRGR